MSKPAQLKTYGDRAEHAINPTAKLLLHIIERKKTNLAVSVDVTISIDFLSIIEAVGPYVCLIKARASNEFVETYFVLTMTQDSYRHHRGLFSLLD